MKPPADTIFALSSGALPAGVAVVRLSGPRAFRALEALTQKPLLEARQAALRKIVGRSGLMLDKALVLTFQAPHSFTGEDVVELHLHGSRAVVHAVLGELGEMIGLRQAEAGEFSRRAFENGRLDLIEAEGLAELISAETEMQRRLAVEQSFGGQSALYEGWAQRLTYARAMIEAELDFADEDDVPGSVADKMVQDIRKLQDELGRHLTYARAGEIIRDGYKIAIIGAPNAGKSSLLNALASRDIAIVTEVAGTTRDIIHVDLDLDGYLVKLFDTAGLRDSEDLVEQEGIRRAWMAIEEADLVIHLEEIDSRAERPELPRHKEILWVGSKSDLHQTSLNYDLCLSAKTGEGIPGLRAFIVEKIQGVWAGGSVPTRQRQLDLLKIASNSIRDALNARELEFRAEHLRSAAAALGRITGRVDVEQLLDVIFSQFCIGK
ncbi:tRNA modification GTPase [Pseudorhizobium tarimense]|uniref:tRNA modification GTPase MnmE n=1 Tax=Pseudorhizobium tarimense TaxID=1079109 RepID=A0ABV2H8A0_9HYPH|nr:tRNA uridine-5-carboxymethylaminomethyl(34) synthesis GTPase MnmE [Pseudorhizobium tarimense]MCJ8519828.1 tRNA uridine-5-carboxymethylaminomethyl(34) synthesis GTPase MnmE [Pseudorhizobium tarimense]